MATSSLSRDFRKPTPYPGQHENVYDGVVLPPFIKKKTLEILQTWQARDDDIFTVAYPKSGKIVSVRHSIGVVHVLNFPK